MQNVNYNQIYNKIKEQPGALLIKNLVKTNY